ncbi:hypothetical protein TRFO_15358 [Tritrichomonas foetus]|uniref:Condensation domain-containing protein n=1 Tax=Tritrichomonas foetus TaxID=1144522 RepID=A0A1J4KSP6_9EUKA|nr:hypothetical protein TRFO_15358 [Tritrichomonas foetus]|eukprot:OHT14313.1 hypothetical protein TRFO_15358 [Tritrichomonas foetus]
MTCDMICFLFTSLMSIKYRPASHFELGQLTSNVNTQLCIELTDSRYVSEYIEKIQNLMIGLHLSFDGDNLIPHKDTLDIVKLPQVENVQDACEWFAPKMVPYSERIGLIAANDRFIVLNTNHIVGDGGTFVKLIKDIQNPSLHNLILNGQYTRPIFPIPVEDEFSEQIQNLDLNFHKLNNLAPLTQSFSKLEKNDPTKWAKSIFFRTNVNKFKCWDSNLKKCHKMTDYLWTSLLLSMNAFNGKLGPIGCSTCVDLRDISKNGKNCDAHTNIYSVIIARAPVSRGMTIGELGNYIRSDFMNRKLHHEPLFILHHGGEILHYDDNRPGSYADLSQLAPFEIKDPIKDVWASVHVKDGPLSFLSLLGQAVVNNETNLNVFGGRLQYRESKFVEKDAIKIMKSIDYFLQNVELDRFVGDVFDELKNFQNSL